MAMNFFQDQDAARRATRRLVLLFLLAVTCVVIAVNLVLGVAWLEIAAPRGAWSRLGLAALPPYFLPTTTGVVLLLILGGTALQLLELSAGGEAVARMLGARPLQPDTRDPLERRLRDVVEEMAIAAGLPVPRIFVLEEDGINAFAAGHGPGDAIVAVTRGALGRLNREQVQGVVGHEFSHILNGDMALNMRLVGVVHGLLVLSLFGRFLVELGNPAPTQDARGRGMPPLVVIGLCILAVGYIGVFFGRWIKAAVSRQREFLADASSVQFTRNPDGIGGALRCIAGLDPAEGGAITNRHAETFSHQFLAPALSALAGGMLASHPPLAERIQRIYGRPMDPLPVREALPEHIYYPAAEPVRPPLEFAAGGELPSPVAAAAALAGADASVTLTGAVGRPGTAALDHGSRLREAVDKLGLRSALEQSAQAALVVYAVLLDRQAAVRQAQLAGIRAQEGPAAAARCEDLAGRVAQLPPGWRLPLVDMATPALRSLDPAGRARLLAQVQALIRADGRVTLVEYLLATLVRRRLSPPVPGGRGQLADAGADSLRVLAVIARARLPQDPARALAAGWALLGAGAPPDPGALDPASIDAALERLARLAPLQKPTLIKACVATAYVDGQTDWQAASCLRTVCAALDCPLPPELEEPAP
jgi:Zn-dependent protease with chaperone function